MHLNVISDGRNVLFRSFTQLKFLKKHLPRIEYKMSSSHNSDQNDNIGAVSEGSPNNHHHIQPSSDTVDDESDADFVTAPDDISVGAAHDSVSDDDFVTAPDIPADIPVDIGVIQPAARGMQVDDQNATAAEPVLRDNHIHNADQNIAGVQDHINADEEEEFILPVPQEEFDEQFVDAAEVRKSCICILFCISILYMGSLATNYVL